MDEGPYLQGFTPTRAHLPLREVYGEFLHHNDWMHLAGGVLDNTTWKSFWRWIAAQSASWYYTHPGKLGRRFTALLTVEWQGLLNQK